MNEPLSTEPYKGVRDFYPADWARLQAVFSSIRTTLTQHGYEEYNASPLERAELYESKTSEEIVNEQTYTFTDRGDRRVTLRPEMTPTLARLVAQKRKELVFPLRWFSIGNRFRYERPQKGRLREFYQTDVDLVGLPAGEADMEAIMVAAAVLQNFGATANDYVIRVNSRTLLNAACDAAGLSGEDVKKYLRLLDRKAKMPADEFAAAVAEITATDPLELIASDDPRIDEHKRALMHTLISLKERGIENVLFDSTLVRGFDYYTGIIFEIFDVNPENPRALFGGGRYDGLVSLFGGDPIPAVGFAIGDVTLMDFLETHGLLPEAGSAPQVYVGTMPDALTPARIFCEWLMASGIRVFMNLSDRAIGDQVREADRRGIPFFIAFGENESKSGVLRIKKLAASSEDSVDVQDAVSYLKDALT